jgi:hypothetical protein
VADKAVKEVSSPAAERASDKGHRKHGVLARTTRIGVCPRWVSQSLQYPRPWESAVRHAKSPLPPRAIGTVHDEPPFAFQFLKTPREREFLVGRAHGPTSGGCPFGGVVAVGILSGWCHEVEHAPVLPCCKNGLWWAARKRP